MTMFFHSFSEVLQDLEQDIPYDALSTKIDVAAGHWGIYNFYRLQVGGATEAYTKA